MLDPSRSAGPGCEEPNNLLGRDSFEILNRPVRAMSREFTRVVPVDSEHECETSAPSRFHPGDSILRNARPRWVSMLDQLLQACHENVRFRFAVQVQSFANYTIHYGLKNIANSCLLQDRHSISA